MNYVKVETQGTEQAFKLANTIKEIVIDALAAQANDGKISADEIAVIAMAHFTKVMGIVGEIKGIVEEVREAPVAFTRSLIIPLSEIGEIFVDKKAE